MHYIGSYNFNLDQKKRLCIPAKWKTNLGISVVVTKGVDNCLVLRSEEEFKKFSNDLLSNEKSKSEKDYRFFLRRIFGNSVNISVKNQRILIPQELLTFANIKKEAQYVAIGDAIEIWNPIDFIRVQSENN